MQRSCKSFLLNSETNIHILHLFILQNTSITHIITFHASCLKRGGITYSGANFMIIYVQDVIKISKVELYHRAFKIFHLSSYKDFE